MIFPPTNKNVSVFALLIGVAIVTAIIVMPTPVHAGMLDDLWKGVLDFDLVASFFDLIITVLTAVITLLGQLLQFTQEALKWILTLPIVGGITVVTEAWTLLRDFCNMFFIVILIVISFATIFNAAGWLGKYYYQSALVPLIIGAIVINFSLAIGRTITLASNEVSKIFVNIMPDPGTILIGILKPQIPQIAPPAIPAPEAVLKGAITLDETDEKVKQLMAACRKELDPKSGDILCAGDDCALKNQTAKSEGTCRLEVSAILNGTTEAAALAKLRANYEAGLSRTGTQVGLIVSQIGQIVMFVMIISCLGTAFLFLGFRIIAIWILLAGSAIAWFSYAIPGKELFNKWWTTFIAWNVFGPLYLFCLWPGLIMLRESGQILTALSTAGARPGEGLIQIFFFYAFAIAIFIGGLGLALKSSFATTVKGTALVGGWAQKFGVFDSAGMAPGRLAGRGASFISEQTGLTNYTEAAKARLRQTKEDIIAEARGRFPRVLGTKEEGLAAARRFAGVRGADIEYEKEIAKRIKNQKDILDAAVNKLPKPEQDAYLQKQLKSGNRDAALAAGEILLGKGKLDITNRQSMLKDYEKISPTAKKEFQKRVTEQTQKEARRNPYGSFTELKAAAAVNGKKEDIRKFLEAAIQGETGKTLPLDGGQMLELANLLETPDDKRAFLEAATKSGRNKIAAIEAMADLTLIRNRDGSVVRAEQAITDRAGSLSDTDLLDAEDYFTGKKQKLPPALEEKMKKALKQPEKFGQIIRNVSGPDQQIRVLEQYADLKKASAQARVDLKVVQRKDRKYADRIKQLKKQADKEKDPNRKAKLSKLINATEEHRDTFKDRTAELRKNTST